MPISTRVLVFDGPHRMHIEDRPLPEPGPGQALIRVARVGICGSDLHGYTGESGRRLPGMIMGHEASGWLEEVGPDADGPPPGSVVTFNPALPCDGSCGHTVANHCARLRVIGVTPDDPGAFADALLVPADRVVPIDGLSLEAGATIEPVAVALQAVRRAGDLREGRAAVIGGGMIGLCIALVLRAEGVDPVVSEPIRRRRDIAGQAGISAVPPEELESLDPFHLSFDAVGVSTTASTALRLIPKGGTTVFVGLGLPEITLPLFDLVVPERTVVGSFCYSDEVFREAVERTVAGELDTGPLIGPVVGFDEAHRAFEDLATGESAEVKVLVRIADPT